jgi:hypothetical protein
MVTETPDHVFDEILEQIRAGSAVLFLGAGSTRNCRKPDGTAGLTGDELAMEIVKKLNGNKLPSFSVPLTEAAEYYTTWKAAARGGLDKFIQERLRNLQPTIGHYIAATFPWRAIITTNYNQVAEDYWSSAVSEGYAANEILPIRTDDDLMKHAGNTTHTRVYKPHGCITIQKQKQHRMVITSLDYFESERIRPKMYHEIRSLGETCTTLFIGYSMTDYTFRNIFYRLYSDLGEWAVRSFSVSPVAEEQKYQWMARSLDKSFNTTLINDAFDTFMIRLALKQGRLIPQLKQKILDNWNHISTVNNAFITGLTKQMITKLKDAS